jgi:hypothetical protein
MVYFLSEIGIVTLVYFAYFLSKKKWSEQLSLYYLECCC